MNARTWLDSFLTLLVVVGCAACAGSDGPESFEFATTSGTTGNGTQGVTTGPTPSTGSTGATTGGMGQTGPVSSGPETSVTGSTGSAAGVTQGTTTGALDAGATSPGDAGGAGDGTSPAAEGGASGSNFPAASDLTANGPFTGMSEPGASGYTVFFPEPLGEEGRKHPIATWGNGATTVPGLFALLPHLASHGFVVVASDNAFVTGEEIRAGIDWLFAENERADSRFFGKLDTQNVAAFGYSLGSMGTFEIADDPRLTTTVHISGGAMDKSVVPNLRHPAAFFCGNGGDIAFENCESDFEMAQVPVFYGAFPGDHLAILGTHTTQINEVVTGWFRWRLMHDDSLESMFVGPDCSVCQNPEWTVKQKDFDTAP